MPVYKIIKYKLYVKFIKKSPKAELHLHIEGTLEPDQMFVLAKKNNIFDRDYAFHLIENLQNTIKTRWAT